MSHRRMLFVAFVVSLAAVGTVAPAVQAGVDKP